MSYPSKVEGNGQGTVSELSILNIKVFNDLKMRTIHKGQERMKKVYSAGCGFAHVVRAESVSEGFSGDAQKLEGHISNGGKPGALVRTKNKSIQNGMTREGPLKGKLTISDGNPVLEASVDSRGDCFQFGAIKRKLIGNGDLPSAKRSLFKDERGNISKSFCKSESTNFTEAKNNKDPSIIMPGSMKANNYIPSMTTPCDSKNPPRLMKSFKGSCDVSKSSSTDIEDLTNKSFNWTNGMNFKNNKTSVHLLPRRRALRFVEDDDVEECRTPIHHVTAVTLLREYSGTFDSERKSHMQPESHRYPPQNASLSDMGIGFIGNVGSRVNQKHDNVTENMETMESCYSASKLCNVDGDVLKYSADLLAGSNSAKKKRCMTAPNGRTANNELEAKYNISGLIVTEEDGPAGQRSDIKRDATSADRKLTGSTMSMKHLIAAAQAKRRQAHSYQLLDGSSTPVSSLTPKCVNGRSPNLMSTMQILPSGGDLSQKDEKWFQTSVPSEPPPTSYQFFPVKQRDHEDYYDHRPSTRNLQPADSSSGSTEAAVARDALEGMIETLSRTRDSIGRATRHAIDCAKYGIANEVVDLLIHKLEDEPSLSHRIDLFFLVDSITQCSHTQKGIAGASYVPVVQAALPRLLGAAAPAGASSHENRRQCLKVLRLWLERRILPEYFLRHCMDEIEARNDGLNSEFSSRIPSCSEQCVDDPIRDMESLLVDQYGSNTTFLFPGILSAHVLKGGEDFPSSTTIGTADCSQHEVLLGSEGRPMEAHHHALEHVENEIEMEDALLSPDERSIGEGSSYSSAPHMEHCSVVESTCDNQNELLLLSADYPSLPLDPPTFPPLPPSPPPPTPPPPSSPPPMPPPQSPPTVPSPPTQPLPSELHGMHFMHQVSYSSQLFQQCGETIQQMPPHSPLTALKILNHPLSSSEMPSDHLSHGNSTCQHHLQQKYGHFTSTFPNQRKYDAEEQWMSRPSDSDQDYSNAWSVGGRSPSCSIAPFVPDDCCRLNTERTSTSIDFYQPQHYSSPSRASLPGNSFPKFTGIDFWRPT